MLIEDKATKGKLVAGFSCANRPAMLAATLYLCFLWWLMPSAYAAVSAEDAELYYGTATYEYDLEAIGSTLPSALAMIKDRKSAGKPWTIRVARFRDDAYASQLSEKLTGLLMKNDTTEFEQVVRRHTLCPDQESTPGELVLVGVHPVANGDILKRLIESDNVDGFKRFAGEIQLDSNDYIEPDPGKWSTLYTPLYYAVSASAEKMTKFLLTQGVDPNKGANNNGFTPMDRALRLGNKSLIDMLDVAGAEQPN